MSAKKHVLRLKRRKAASDGDIRYLGPLSYRAFEILGWLCVVMCVGIIVMTVLKSMSSKQGTGQGLPQGILQYPAQLSALLLLIAGISRIIRNSDEYRQQLWTYLGLTGILAAGAALVFQRTVLAAIDRLFLEPDQVLPMVEKAFADISGNRFVAFNLFIDIFLCILMFYFVNARPKRFFTGKWVLILRACAALPFACAVVCTCLKYQAVRNNAALPFLSYPILTVKPVTTYALFLFLAIYVKRKEIQFCKDGRTIEACQASLRTRRNSLRFGVILAIALAVTALLDNFLQYGTAQLLLKPLAPADEDALAWSLLTAKRIGFGGESLVLLIAAPIMLLYSFNRVPKWRIFSVLAPLLAIGLVILLWMGSKGTGTGEYIVEGKVPKFSITGIQQMLDYVKKASTVIMALFSA